MVRSKVEQTGTNPDEITESVQRTMGGPIETRKLSGPMATAKIASLKSRLGGSLLGVWSGPGAGLEDR